MFKSRRELASSIPLISPRTTTLSQISLFRDQVPKPGYPAFQLDNKGIKNQPSGGIRMGEDTKLRYPQSMGS